MSNAALAFFAGLGKGYLQQDEAERNRARQIKLDDREEQKFNWMAAEQAQKDKERSAIENAGGTAEVMEGALGDQSAGPPVMAKSGTTPGEYRMVAPGGVNKSFNTIAEAQGNMSEYNKPEARTDRQIMALQQYDPAKAMQLQTMQRQGTLAEHQLNQAKEDAERNKIFRYSTTTLARDGWQGIHKIYENYNDGNTAKVEEDGKGGATITKIGPDGNALGKGKHFSSEQEFVQGMYAEVDPGKWLDIEMRKADQARAQLKDDRNFGLREKEVNSTTSLNNARAAHLYQGAGSRGVGTSRAERTEARNLLGTLQSSLSGEIRDIDAQIKAALPPYHMPGKPLPPDVQELQAQRADAVARKRQVEGELTGLLGEVRPGMAAGTFGAKQHAPNSGGQRVDAKQASEAPKLPAPKVGVEQMGFRFKGGNPSDKANWEKL